ncbi:MAG: peptide ABC transporter substrate-binding protein [Planctomycetes bacterium]|nr:peptide ABC transporter substrate-binding protein [Planctomycetota bacterium]
MFKLLVPVVLLAVVVIVSVVSDRPLPPADFTISNGTDVTTLDIQRASWMQDLRIMRCLFEGLVRHDVFTVGYDPAPAVAQRWEISPDGLVYTFHLRGDARWSNGEAVTAEDFVFSWRRGLLPDTAADYVAFFWMIKGGREFYDWRVNELARFNPKEASADELWERTLAKFNALVGVKALDSRTLRVELEAPVPYFLDIVAFPVFYPVYPPLLRQYERVDPKSGRLKSERGWTKPPRLISNGPFELTVWRFKRDMRMERNPHYWDGANVAIDSIAVPSIEDPNAQVLAFQTGAVDWVANLTVNYRGDIWADKVEFYAEHAAEYEALKARGLDIFEIDRHLPSDPRKNIHAVPSFATYFWNFNCMKTLPDGRANPFRDPRVRRAFAMTVDKRVIVDDIRRLGEPIARGLIPPGSIGGYESPAGLKCLSDAKDERGKLAIAAEARALLAEAGYPDPAEFPPVELLFNKDAGHDLVAQALGKNWQRYLGVPVRLEQKELKVYKDDLKKANYMTSRAGWYGDYGDPTTFLDLLRSDDGNNDRKYDSPEYDALLDAAQAETDPARRLAILSRAERKIMEEDLPMIPLFHYVTMYLFDADKVSGLNPHPRTTQNLFLIDMLGDGKGPDVSRRMGEGAHRPAVAGDDGDTP